MKTLKAELLELQGRPMFMQESDTRHLMESVALQLKFEGNRSSRQTKPQGYTLEAGIATVPIRGNLFPEESPLSELFGSSYARIIQNLEAASSDKAVHSIVLDIHSPGGFVHGNHATYEAIKQAAKTKHVIAYVDGSAMSAAYCLACAADEIILSDPNSIVGGIGASSVFVDDSGLLEKQGIRREKITSSHAGEKAPDITTDEGQRVYRDTVLNELESVFVKQVASERDVGISDIKNLKGGVRVGQRAIDAKLADRVLSRLKLLQELVDRDKPKPRKAIQQHTKGEPMAPKTQTRNDEILKVTQTYQDRFPELTSELNSICFSYLRNDKSIQQFYGEINALLKSSNPVSSEDETIALMLEGAATLKDHED